MQELDTVVGARRKSCIDHNAGAAKPFDCEKGAEQTRQFGLWVAQRRALLLRAAARIYAAHLSIQDMSKAADFYESDAGQRLMAASPNMDDQFAKEYDKQIIKPLSDQFVPTHSDAPVPQR